MSPSSFNASFSDFRRICLLENYKGQDYSKSVHTILIKVEILELNQQMVNLSTSDSSSHSNTLTDARVRLSIFNNITALLTIILTGIKWTICFGLVIYWQ